MDKALIKQLYKHAYYVSRTFRIAGYEHEDLQQECVIRALEVIKDKKVWTWIYVRKAMYHRLLNILREQKSRPRFEEMQEVPYRIQYIYLQTPSKKAKQLVEVLLEDFSLKDAYKDLGWSYNEGEWVWREAKNFIRRTCKESPILEL